MNDTAQVVYLPQQPHQPGDRSAPVENNPAADPGSLLSKTPEEQQAEERARQAEERARERASREERRRINKLQEHDSINRHVQFHLREHYRFAVKFSEKVPLRYNDGSIYGYTLGLEVEGYNIPNAIWVFYGGWDDTVEVVVNASANGITFAHKRVNYNKHESGHYAYDKISGHIATYVRRRNWQAEMQASAERNRAEEEQKRAEAERRRIERRQNVIGLISDASHAYPELPTDAHNAAAAIYEYVAGKDQASAILMLVIEALARRRGVGLDQF